ncbi:hypothetical protein B0H12DRAFT_13536 [Mycena haematopus]|nr:hypothetical protein B0H12DRAFT_13536 [Mycena haematopus]
MLFIVERPLSIPGLSLDPNIIWMNFPSCDRSLVGNLGTAVSIWQFLALVRERAQQYGYIRSLNRIFTRPTSTPSYMADTPTSAVLNTRRRRAMIACTNCRRRKIKCVTTEEPPQHPCARCTKRGLECEYVAVDEPTTPESPSHPLGPSYNPVPYQTQTPGYAHYAPHQPQYPAWNAPPQSPPVHPAYPSHSPSYNPSQYPMPQNPYGGSQGYPPQYGFPPQFAATTPTNQWQQGSVPLQSRCTCRNNPCYCGGARS